MKLSLIPSMERPALLAEIPSSIGRMTVLDVGGNLEITAKQLVEFAHFGVRYHQKCYGVEKPRVAILNIGVESEKGTRELKEAYQMLQGANGESFHFVGNMEPKELFHEKVHVLVSSGFAGNIFLKTVEGVSDFVLDLAEERTGQDLSDVKKRFSDESSIGAIVAGLDALVVKCHGRATVAAIQSALIGAERMLRNDFKLRI